MPQAAPAPPRDSSEDLPAAEPEAHDRSESPPAVDGAETIPDPLREVRQETAERKRTPRPARPWRHKRALAAGLAAAVVLSALAILALNRDAIIAAFPQASDLYAMIGLQERLGAGLDIGAVTSVREETADGEALLVEGEITNVSSDPRRVPSIRVTLFDTDDVELQHVVVLPDQEMLEPGERFSFTARLEQPDPTARRIKVTFAPRREAA